MKFRKKVTFNGHDTKSEVVEGRTVVTLGMVKRCNISLMALIRLGADQTVHEVFNHLVERFGADSYVKGDIASALRKMVGGGLVVQKGRGRATRYTASRNALQKWRDLPKDYI